MRRPVTLLLVTALVLAIVPGWTGEARLRLLGRRAEVKVRAVALDPADPARRRLGALDFLDGVELTSPDPAFGGFSALLVKGRRVTLLSDGGNIVAFTRGANGQVTTPVFANLPDGPGIGWDKADRDSESLAVDRATGRLWVGFEKYNMIMRFTPGFARSDGAVRPVAMRTWPDAGGPESLVRLPDGRFVSISESARPPAKSWGARGGRGQARQGLIWAGDPVDAGQQPSRFTYLAEGKFDVADAAALPDGRLLVLERAFDAPFRFHNRIVLVPAGAVRPGAVVKGALLAELDAPLVHDNFEGITASQEGADTVIWLVSDDNRTPVLQRTLLLRFRMR
jgi:hypothetical protein